MFLNTGEPHRCVMTDAEFNLRGKSPSFSEGWIGHSHSLFSFALFSGKIQSGIMIGISYLLSNLTLKFRLCKTWKRIGNSIRTPNSLLYSVLRQLNNPSSLSWEQVPDSPFLARTPFASNFHQGKLWARQCFLHGQTERFRQDRAKKPAGEASETSCNHFRRD